MKNLIPAAVLALVYGFNAPGLQQKPEPRAVEPIRIMVVTEPKWEDSKTVCDFYDAFMAELNTRRDVVGASRGAVIDIYLTATQLTAGGRLRGYAASVMVLSRAKPRDNYWLSLKTGSDLKAMARDAVREMELHVLDSFREKK